MPDTRWITIDPAHFHAALVQKEMPVGVIPTVHIYAPVGGELAAHVGRLAGFNTRAPDPTRWNLEIHAGPDFVERWLAERPGNVVILAGRNHRKMEYLRAAVENGLHVLADKPWIIVPEQLLTLEAVLDRAERDSLVALDIMTERHEATSRVQRALVQAPEVIGQVEVGTESQPSVSMESTHYLLKKVAGSALRRPPEYFDIHQQGEGLSDVGTHLVDLVQWLLFPEQAIDAERDIELLHARRWPRILTRTDFQRITGHSEFPPYLADQLQAGCLPYFCNNRVSYTIRRVHVTLNVLWDFEPMAGAGDMHLAVVRGTRSRVEVRQGQNENFIPEVYVTPARPSDKSQVAAAVRAQVAILHSQFPGIEAVDYRDGLWVRIPDEHRVGHEAHFGRVVQTFLTHVREGRPLPAWEKPCMLAKYRVTTGGVQLARES